MVFISVPVNYDEVNKIINTPIKPVQLHEKGVGHAIFTSLKNNPKNTVQIQVDTNITQTSAELLQQSVRAAIHMKQLGVQPGDLVTILAENEIPPTVVCTACYLTGAVNVILDPSLSDLDLKQLFQETESKVIYISETCEERTERLLKELGAKSTVVCFEKEWAEILTEKDGEDDFEPYVVASLDELCAIKFSSGTTGVAKGIQLSHKYMLYHTQYSIVRVFSAISMYWISPTIYFVQAIIHENCVRLFAKQLDAKNFWNNVEEFNVQMIQINPYMAPKLLATLPADHKTSLGFIFLGGSPVPTDLLKKLRVALPNTVITQTFGMTETFLYTNPFDSKSYDKLASVGGPSTNVSYKIVDPDTGKNLGFHQSGEIRVKSEYFCTEYYKHDSSDLYDEDGFVKTGDVCYYDEDFCFFHVDRIKELFKCCGEIVIPSKLEALLATHPDVENCAIVPVPHEVEGNRVKALVVKKKGGKVTEDELTEFYNAMVNKAGSLSAGLRFVDDLPLTPTGKINRKVAKKIAVE